jgi:hypothetical protein
MLVTVSPARAILTTALASMAIGAFVRCSPFGEATTDATGSDAATGEGGPSTDGAQSADGPARDGTVVSSSPCATSPNALFCADFEGTSVAQGWADFEQFPDTTLTSLKLVPSPETGGNALSAGFTTQVDKTRKSQVQQSWSGTKTLRIEADVKVVRPPFKGGSADGYFAILAVGGDVPAQPSMSATATVYVSPDGKLQISTQTPAFASMDTPIDVPLGTWFRLAFEVSVGAGGVVSVAVDGGTASATQFLTPLVTGPRRLFVGVTHYAPGQHGIDLPPLDVLYDNVVVNEK